MKSGSVQVLKDGSFQKDDEGIRKLEDSLPKKPQDIEIKKCSNLIPNDLAKGIIEVMERELYRVKHPRKDSGGLDGITYHFSMNKGLRTLSGQTWSPSSNLPTGKLVNISEALYNYCFSEAKLEHVNIAVSKAK